MKKDAVKELIEAYVIGCKKRNYFKIAASEDPEHKNFKYFEKVIQMFGNVGDWDAITYIEANLEDKIRFPAQLATKVAFKRFRDYKDKINAMSKDNKEDNLTQAFKNSVNSIIARVGKYDPSEFFDETSSDMSPGLALYMKGMISKQYCVVCKPFWIKIKNLDPDILQMFNIEELRDLRERMTAINKKSLSALKKIVKEEYWI